MAPPSRHAEARYREAQEARARAEAVAEQRRQEQHARSQRQAEDARRALASPHRSLSLALGWFADEWTASLPVVLHDATEEDALGAPDWHERWRRWLFAHDPGRDPGDPRAYDPLRRAWVAMYRSGSAFDRAGAEYLFRLASLGFDVERAGLRMDPPITLRYVAWYAEKAIDRLREKVVEAQREKPREVPQPEWIARTGWVSDAQAHAEAVDCTHPPDARDGGWCARCGRRAA